MNFKRTILGISITLMVGWYSTAHAIPSFRIEWLDESWDLSMTTDGVGNYEAVADVDTGNSIPTAKAKTSIEGDGSSATAEVKFSRPFKVVMDGAPTIPVLLQDRVGAKDLLPDGTDPGAHLRKKEPGLVKLRARATVTDPEEEETFLEYYTFAEGYTTEGWTISSGNNESTWPKDVILEEGEIQASQTYQVNGYIHANGDSDRIYGDENRAEGLLGLEDPIQIVDPIDDYYYDFQWESGWNWRLTGTRATESSSETLELAFDLFGDWVASGVPPPWDSLVDLGIEEGLSVAFGLNTKIKIDANFNDGNAYVYAWGEDGGDAHVSIYYDRLFTIAPNSDALAVLQFNGFLDGLLDSSSNTESSLDLAEVSVDGTGLYWQKGETVSHGGTADIDETIRAMGLVELNKTYTFEGLLRVDSNALPGATLGDVAFSDFLSSFGGDLQAAPTPEPSTLILVTVALLSIFGIGYRRRKRLT